MPISFIQYRRDPSPGTVVLISIDGKAYAYIRCIDIAWYWLFNFVTDYPSNDLKLFDKDNYLLPFLLTGSLSASYPDICQLPLMPGEALAPVVVKQIPEELRIAKGWPTCYRVRRKGGGYNHISEEQAASMYKEIGISGPPELENFIRQRLPEMRRIEVPPEQRWTPPVKKIKPSKVQQMPVLFEVHFRCKSEVMNRSADEIAEELGDALALQDLGSLMTMDSGGVDSDFEVILEANPRRTKSALRQIRSALKRLKAPADTRILEVREIETLEHSLVAPSA